MHHLRFAITDPLRFRPVSPTASASHSPDDYKRRWSSPFLRELFGIVRSIRLDHSSSRKDSPDTFESPAKLYMTQKLLFVWWSTRPHLFKMLNFTSEPTRSSNTFNQFSATFRRIFNPFLINGRKSKTKDLDKVSAEWKALQWRVFFGLKSVHMVHTFPNRISRITKQIKILKDFEFFNLSLSF